MKAIEFHQPSPAEYFYDSVREAIDKITGSLPVDHRIRIECHVPGRAPIWVSHLGYDIPIMIVVYGTDLDSGNQVAVLAHVNSVQLVTEIVPPQQPDKPARKIGFIGKAKDSAPLPELEPAAE